VITETVETVKRMSRWLLEPVKISSWTVSVTPCFTSIPGEVMPPMIVPVSSETRAV